MSKYLPQSLEKEQALEQKLAGGLLENVDRFIQLYNAGYVNPRNSEIKNVLNEVLDTYKNLKEVDQQIKFIGIKEIYAEELQEELILWVSITKIKRAIEELIALEELNHNSIIAFQHRGFLYRVEEKREEDKNVRELTKISKESFYDKKITGETLAHRYSTRTQIEPDIFEFTVNDITNIDDDFIQKMYELLPS